MALSINVVDMGNYYMIYGMVTMIVIMMLLWFFIRVNMTTPSCTHEGFLLYEKEIENTTPEAEDAIKKLLSGNADEQYLNFKMTDREYKKEKHGLLKGMYGDVPVYLYDDGDIPYVKEWREMHHGIYIPNSKTYWVKANRPLEKDFWESGRQE